MSCACVRAEVMPGCFMFWFFQFAAMPNKVLYLCVCSLFIFYWYRQIYIHILGGIIVICLSFIIKPTRCTNFPNLFWHETLRVSGSSSVHHQEFIRCTLGTDICHTVCRQFTRRTRLELHGVPTWSCSKAVLKRLRITYTTAECTVNKLLMVGRGTARNM